jgi:hypothetical protein
MNLVQSKRSEISNKSSNCTTLIITPLLENRATYKNEAQFKLMQGASYCELLLIDSTERNLFVGPLAHLHYIMASGKTLVSPARSVALLLRWVPLYTHRRRSRRLKQRDFRPGQNQLYYTLSRKSNGQVTMISSHARLHENVHLYLSRSIIDNMYIHYAYPAAKLSSILL